MFKHQRGNQKQSDPTRDDYGTNMEVWDTIFKDIPKDKIIWMPFYMDGKCGDYVRSLGYQVVHEKKDFYKWQPDKWDIIIDNPPFSDKPMLLSRLHQLDKPFIILYPFVSFYQIAFRPYDIRYNYKIITPRKRFSFYKTNNKNNYTFSDTILICHNIDFWNLERKINHNFL